MKKRRFTAEFKKDAARMLIIEGISAQEVSEQLGVKASLLYRWSLWGQALAVCVGSIPTFSGHPRRR